MDDGFLGEVRPWAGNFAPRGWTFCRGQILAINQYTALFSLLGATYGGDGRSTFAVPNLMSRVAVGTGTGPGAHAHNWILGMTAGSDTISLSAAYLPAHTHEATMNVTLPGVTGLQGAVKVNVSSDDTSVVNEVQDGYLAQGGNVPDIYTDVLSNQTYLAPAPVNGMVASFTGLGATVTLGTTGSGADFDVVQPSLAVNYIICIDGGEYPARN